MVETKRIVVLANSRKPPGRCVAGIEIVNGRPAGWIRPVGDEYGAGLKPWERRLPNDVEPLPLDVVDFVVKDYVPLDCHVENWLVDANSPRRGISTINFDELAQLTSDSDTLWTNNDETFLGLNDRVAEFELGNLSDSIVLIRPQGLVLRAKLNSRSNLQELRAEFVYRGVRYRLKVTDPVYEARYLTGVDGNFQISRAYLTISLGEPWSSDESSPRYASKLVAAVIEPNGDG